ncbi:MAG: hypothetical protein AB1Z98_17820 [Nannocystaceae bacterium]
MRIDYTIEIGGSTISSQPRSSGPPLVDLRVERGLGGAGGRARIELGPVGSEVPSIGQAVRVELDAGQGGGVVFTGEVETVTQGVSATVVEARDGLAKLGEHELERGYEEVSAGFIVEDLVSASGAEPGEIEDGPTFPRYLVHGGARALGHAERLARLVGAELYTDGDGKVCFARPSAGSPGPSLRWGDSLLRVDLEREPLRSDSLAVWGEGSAGTDGADKEHWLAADLSGVSGSARVSDAQGERSVTPQALGDRPRALIDGAIRSVDAADEIARAHMLALALRPVRGSVLTLGLPEAAPGLWIELVDLPAPSHPLGTGLPLPLRVRGFVHRLSPRSGLVTELRF